MKKLLLILAVTIGLSPLALAGDSLMILDTAGEKYEQPLMFCTYLAKKHFSLIHILDDCVDDVLSKANSTSNQTLVERLLSTCQGLYPGEQTVKTKIINCYENDVLPYVNDLELSSAIENANCPEKGWNYAKEKADARQACVEKVVSEYVSQGEEGPKGSEVVTN